MLGLGPDARPQADGYDCLAPTTSRTTLIPSISASTTSPSWRIGRPYIPIPSAAPVDAMSPAFKVARAAA